MSDAGSVTIPFDDYLAIQERLDWLDCLESAGVDNWSGIDYAREMLTREEDESESGDDI